jgi:hypothetical protein
MPIEREFKYILKHPSDLWDRLLELRKTTQIDVIDIKQGYLSKGGRIRSRLYNRRVGVTIGQDYIAEPQYIFTYKHPLTGRPGVLEIECDISSEDFDLAWEDADHKIDKTRFVLECQASGGVWEIDFFRDKDGIYLALAEFEVPAEAGPPDRLNPLVQEYLVFSVPEDDRRFQNRKLCNRAKVEKLLKEIV